MIITVIKLAQGQDQQVGTDKSDDEPKKFKSIIKPRKKERRSKKLERFEKKNEPCSDNIPNEGEIKKKKPREKYKVEKVSGDVLCGLEPSHTFKLIYAPDFSPSLFSLFLFFYNVAEKKKLFPLCRAQKKQQQKLEVMRSCSGKTFEIFTIIYMRPQRLVLISIS